MLELACRTCNIIRGLLLAQGVPAPVAQMAMPLVEQVESKVAIKVKRKITPYQRKYKAAFKKVESKFQNKKGKWLKDGFKRAVKAAHKEAQG